MQRLVSHDILTGFFFVVIYCYQYPDFDKTPVVDHVQHAKWWGDHILSCYSGSFHCVDVKVYFGVQILRYNKECS